MNTEGRSRSNTRIRRPTQFYARLHNGGFSSIKLNRSRRLTKSNKASKKNKTRSLPSSPIDIVSKVGKNTSKRVTIKNPDNGDEDKTLTGARDKLLKMLNKQSKGDKSAEQATRSKEKRLNSHDNWHVESVNAPNNDSAEESSNNSSIIIDSDINDQERFKSIIAEMTTNMDKPSLVDKKQKLREEIAAMEAQLQEQEDEELRSLMRRQEQLRRQLHEKEENGPSTSTSKSKKSSKINMTVDTPDIYVNKFEELTKKQFALIRAYSRCIEHYRKKTQA